MTKKRSDAVPFPTRIDLNETTRADLARGLNVSLASTFDLFTQVKQAHWNLKGAQFVARHELFDDLAKHLRKWGDKLAERVTTLGGYAQGTARLASELSVLPEYDLDAVDGGQHLDALIDRYGLYCAAMRKMVSGANGLGDPATEDLFTEILRDAETDLWFLEAHRTGR